MLKVGDKVRIREDLVEGKDYGSEDDPVTLFDFMAKMRGLESTVMFEDYGYYHLKDGFWWAEEMLEKID